VRFGGVARDVRQPFAVTTPQGWTVTLSAAQVSLGPIYLRNGSMGAGTDEDDGRVVAEVLAQLTVDALNPELGVVEGAAQGTTEPARSAEVRLVEASEGPIAAAAGPGVAVAHVAGVAERAGVAVPFEGALALGALGTATDYAGVLAHRVAHVPVEFTPEGDGTLTLRVDPTHWFDAVVFDPGGAPPDFSARPGAEQLRAGVAAAAGVYLFSWDAPAGR
jgi:hypothetical protein